MKVSLLDTLTMVSLRVRETEQSFLEKVTEKQLLAAHCYEESIGKLALSRSRRKRQYSAVHAYLIRLQCHPHPSGRFSTGHVRVRSLEKSDQPKKPRRWTSSRRETYDSMHHHPPYQGLVNADNHVWE